MPTGRLAGTLGSWNRGLTNLVDNLNVKIARPDGYWKTRLNINILTAEPSSYINIFLIKRFHAKLSIGDGLGLGDVKHDFGDE